MRLTDRQKEILCCIEHRAQEPIKAISSLVGLREHTVRNEIEMMQKAGIITQKRAFVNFYPLGIFDLTLYFSLNPAASIKEDVLVQALSKEPAIAWVASLGGEYQYSCALYCKSFEEAHKILERITSKFENIFADKTISLRSKLLSYGRKYLAPNFRGPVLSFESLKSPIEIDEIDRVIINEVGYRPFDSIREISRKLQLPPATLTRRFGALQEQGIIKGYKYHFNIASLNATQYRLFVQTRGATPNLTAKFEKFCNAQPNITHFIECIGTWDYEIGIEVTELESMNEILSAVFACGGSALAKVSSVQVTS